MARTRAVLLDALGTLVELDDPAPRLRAALLERSGIDVGIEAAGRGFGAEIAAVVAREAFSPTVCCRTRKVSRSTGTASASRPLLTSALPRLLSAIA